MMNILLFNEPELITFHRTSSKTNALISPKNHPNNARKFKFSLKYNFHKK
jgi:hypothetical protein